MKTLWVLTAVLATGLHASARTRRLRAWTGGWYRARAVPRRGGRHERPGLGGSPLHGHCHASRGGLPLPARLSPLMGPIRRRPVGAVSTSDCAATPSLLFTYSRLHLDTATAAVSRCHSWFVLCLAFLAGATQIEVVGVRNLEASGTSCYPEVTSTRSPGGSSSAQGLPDRPPVLAVAVKAFLSARDNPPFKAAPCFPSLNVLMP